MKKIIISLLTLILILNISITVLASGEDENIKKIIFSETGDIYFSEDLSRFDNLNNPSIALVLGGGGARALVNIGIIKALEEENIPIDMLVGTSMGSIIGVMYGSGISVEKMADITKSDFLPSLFELNFPFYRSILTSDKLNNFMEEISPVKKLEDFPLPTAFLKLDLKRKAKYIKTTGKISEAIEGAYTIPFVFPVKENNDSYFVDPGMLELIPAMAARVLGADIVISTVAFDELPYDISLNPFRTWIKLINVSKNYISERIADNYSDVLIEHDVGDYSFMDFHLAEKFIEMGYEQTKSKLPEIKEVLKEKGIENNESQKNKVNISSDIDKIIRDIVNERNINKELDIKPLYYFGQNNSLFNNSVLRGVNYDSQYGLKLGKGRIKAKFIYEHNNSEKLEAQIKILKLRPDIDLSATFDLLGENKRYDIVLQNYNNKIMNEIAYSVNDGKKYLHLGHDYQRKINNIFLKGNLEYFYPFEDGETELLFSNILRRPINSQWDFYINTLLGNSIFLDTVSIYRGSIIDDLTDIQSSLEFKYKYQFEFSKEILQVLLLKGFEINSFLDYYQSVNTVDYALGTGLILNMNVFGIKPINTAAYISYDFKDKMIYNRISFNVSF